MDYYYLGGTTGLENPTSQAIAQWAWDKLKIISLSGIHSVEIRETCTSGARYFNPSQKNYAKLEE